MSDTFNLAFRELNTDSPCQQAANHIRGFSDSFRSESFHRSDTIFSFITNKGNYTRQTEVLREVYEDPKNAFSRVAEGLEEVKKKLQNCIVALTEERNQYAIDTPNTDALKSTNLELFAHAQQKLEEGIGGINSELILLNEAIDGAKNWAREMSKQLQALEVEMTKLADDFTTAGSADAAPAQQQ